ncbi:enoyl-CoA hydratase [Saccharopolyspora gloriosae]|uniref:Enoyl-CoA hydratase n=1 Tax=Saccharopolyspora gloriosae TaxID=455344 RepID=A0A840N9S9_9PSEU|nr:enoyl-CoA hydratase [Saccharopolyspora gloriosae]MBB5068710.1 enoyl-CoA hydratase [Saccharopolyspora gloriosae]
MITTGWDGPIGLITLDRHERRNALDLEHCEALRDAVPALVEQGARALVITGAGSTFCAGADLDGVYGDEFRDGLYDALQTVLTVPVPVIAAVNGPAVGAGAQLALAADLRIAAPDAYFAVPTARNGLAVDPWTVRRLSLLAGGGAARSLLLAADRLGAEVAHQRGVVDRLGDHDAAVAWAREIGELAPLSLRYSKMALNSLDSGGFDPGEQGDELEAAYADCWASEDAAEASRARTERRTPRFQGK